MLLCRLMRFCVLWVLASALPSAAATFVDPLDAPALPSHMAQHSRLAAVARAGNRLVAVGQRGHILVSDDAGKSWRQAAVPLSSDLVAVNFPTAMKGWAVGHDGVVLHSADGGLSWVKQLDGKRAAEAVVAYYQKLAEPDAARLQDEAQRLLQEGADKPLLDVLFVDEREGFVVGAFNLALHTKDGGKTWEPLIDRTANELGLHLYGMVQAGNELYLVGEQGLLRRWERKQERFVTLASPYKGSFFGIVARDATLIAYGMRGNVLRSDDGGQNWRALRSHASDGITAGTVLADGRVVLVTQGGQMLLSKDGGESFSSVKVKTRMAYFGVAPIANGVVVVGAAGIAVESFEQR